MMFGLSIGHLIIISFLFLTSINCFVTYLCSTSALKVLEKTQSYNKAINKIRIWDKYLLSVMTIITSALYVVLSYFYFLDWMVVSDFFIPLSIVSGFVLSLITTFFSRLCYCYACNVLLKTKFNEYECFKENFIYLVSIFFPLFLISFLISTIYIIPANDLTRRGLTAGVILLYLLVWFFTYPYKTILTINAKKIRGKELKGRLDELFIRNDISRYKLYYWDSSKSNEANAMVSGVITYHLFISSTLIDSLNNRELEAVILHEIGHIKKHHFIKSLIYKLVFFIIMFVLLYYSIIYKNTNLVILFVLAFAAILAMGAIAQGSKKHEEEADLYVLNKGYGNDLISALKKVGSDDDLVNKVDKFFSNHPSVSERINKLDNKDK